MNVLKSKGLSYFELSLKKSDTKRGALRAVHLWDTMNIYGGDVVLLQAKKMAVNHHFILNSRIKPLESSVNC